LLLALIFACSAPTFAADLPTAKVIAAEMGLGWNLGNTLEATGGPTKWGNPLPTLALVKAVKAAGFKTIRIPCNWDENSNAVDTINAAWITQVKQVVDWSIAEGLYVVLNAHWDGGWLEDNVTTAKQAEVNAKQEKYWTKIARTFKDYDQHLLFAGTNEPGHNLGDEYFKLNGVATANGTSFMTVLTSYHQTFVNAVRGTGGNNASRTLIVQGPKTDMEITNLLMTTANSKPLMPTDVIADRLMAEVHFYPFNFALMDKDENWGKMFYFWGASNYLAATAERSPGWCDEAYVDATFAKMKAQFVDNNIPVLIGEFGAVMRQTLRGTDLERHLQSRKTYYEFLAKTAKANGLIPVLWDPGFIGDLTMTVIDRETNGFYDLGAMNALRTGFGLTKLPGDETYDIGPHAMKVLYSGNGLNGQVDLGVVKPDFSAYDSIVVRAFVKGEANYDSLGSLKYGYLSLNLVTMSGGYKWADVDLGNPVMNTGWVEYSVPVSTVAKTGALVPVNPSNIQFFGLQAYSRGFHGAIYVDQIVFVDKDQNVRDTLYPFDMGVPSKFEGNVIKVSRIDLDKVEADNDWTTLTKAFDPTVAIRAPQASGSDAFRISTAPGLVRAEFVAHRAGEAKLVLKNLLGQVVATQTIDARMGANFLEMRTDYSGVGILQIELGSRRFSGKVLCN